MSSTRGRAVGFPSTQSISGRTTQNSSTPLLRDPEGQLTAQRRNQAKAKIMRGVATLLAVTLFVSAVSSSVWEASNGLQLDKQVTKLSLRQQILADETRPTQIHLALFDDTSKADATQVGMTISWATAKPTAHSVVRFGRTADDLALTVEAPTACKQYQFCDYSSPWLHHVVIDGELLSPDTTYFYKCGDPSDGWSQLLTFTTAPAIGNAKPTTFAVIGDLGQTEFSEQTIRHLINQPNITAILHAGDISYADSYQPRWDRWGKLVEPLSSTCPWMVSSGNHEEERPCQHNVDRFVAYQERFRMPYNEGDAVQEKNLFFAFRSGLVHFIIVTPYIPSDAASPQYKWLEAELSRVNRAVTPWVVVMMHGPWYNSNTAHQGQEPHVAMKANMEDLLFEHKVDLVYSGHVHAYERSYAVYKEKVRSDGTVYVVLGDGGNREGLAPTYIHPKPEWSAYRQANYGFGLFHVINRTHAQIEMYEDQEKGDARLHDSAWLATTHYRVATSTVAAAKLH